MLTMGRKRSKPRDLSDPRGQLGAYVEAWIDRNYSGDKERFGKALGVSKSAVFKWCSGETGPDLVKLNAMAQLMGLENWAKLAIAAHRNAAKTS